MSQIQRGVEALGLAIEGSDKLITWLTYALTSIEDIQSIYEATGVEDDVMVDLHEAIQASIGLQESQKENIESIRAKIAQWTSRE